VTLDSSCVLLRWMCSTGGGCATLDNSMCYFSGCVPLEEDV
jgi:hypothetical protein